VKLPHGHGDVVAGGGGIFFENQKFLIRHDLVFSALRERPVFDDIPIFKRSHMTFTRMDQQTFAKGNAQLTTNKKIVKKYFSKNRKFRL
jgi:hypothetical protein